MRYNFYSVRIIRKIDQGAYAVYWQEFFKFSGVYVLDYIVDEVAENPDFARTDINIIITDIEELPMRPKADKEFIIKLHESDSPEQYGDAFKKDLATLMDQVDAWLVRHKNLSRVFEYLAEVFINEDYIHFNYCQHSFLKQMDREEMLEIANKYCRCYETLGEHVLREEREMQPSPYLKYAMLNCARKMNDIYAVREDAPMFRQEGMMYAAEGITELDPDFSIGMVLAGLVGLSRPYLWKQGTQYLRRAINLEKNQKYIGFACYCLGHYFEVDRGELEQAWEMYQMLEEIAPDNYRAHFKKGCWALRRKDYKEACQIFGEVLDRMERKKRSGWIRPQEIEYGYKSSLLIAWIKRVHLEARIEAENYRKMADSFSGTALEESNFGKLFFGRKLSYYSECLDKKLSGHTIDNIVHP